MKNKLLAAALATAFLSSAAFAQGSNVTIYGLLQPSIDAIDNDQESGVSMSSNTSRIGFSGTEDLGNGLKAIFQIESNVSFTEQGSANGSTPNSFFSTRDSWVGLAGGFGSLTFGNHQTASIRSTAYLDPLGDSIGDYNNIIGLVRRPGANAGFDSRIMNSTYYTSPKLGAFQVLASYAFATDNNIDDNEEEDNIYSVALTYSAGPLNITVAYERQGSQTVADDKQGFKIGGSYNFGATTLYALWDRIDQGDVSAVLEVNERDAYYVGVKHTIGKIDLVGRYIHATETDAEDDGADNWALAVAYNLSSRTSIAAIYSATTNDDNGTYGLAKTTYVPTNANAGDDLSGFSVRLRHSF